MSSPLRTWSPPARSPVLSVHPRYPARDHAIPSGACGAATPKAAAAVTTPLSSRLQPCRRPPRAAPRHPRRPFGARRSSIPMEISVTVLLQEGGRGPIARASPVRLCLRRAPTTRTVCRMPRPLLGDFQHLSRQLRAPRPGYVVFICLCLCFHCGRPANDFVVASGREVGQS